MRSTFAKRRGTVAVSSTRRLSLVVGFTVTMVAGAPIPRLTPFRGGEVFWARLITGNRAWKHHRYEDPAVAAFIRAATSVNMAPQCRVVDPHDLAALCSQPFVFTTNLTYIHDRTSLANLGAYLRRGGFIYVERCLLDPMKAPSFYRRHLELFTRLLPGAEVRPLQRDSRLYRCFFIVKISDRAGLFGSNRIGIYGVFYHGRPVAVVSTLELFCGPARAISPGRAQLMMITNIYLYALTSGGYWSPQSRISDSNKPPAVRLPRGHTLQSSIAAAGAITP